MSIFIIKKSLLFFSFTMLFSCCLGETPFQSMVNPIGVTSEKFGTLQYLEPCDILLDKNGEYLFVLNAESRDLRKYSLVENTSVENTSVENTSVKNTPTPILKFDYRPNRMTFASNQNQSHIAVVAGESQGVMFWVNTKTMTLEKTIAVGHTPSDVAVFENTAYIANRFSGDVSVVDIAAGKETARWNAGREPIALDVTPDGKLLAVANMLPEDAMLPHNSNTRNRMRIFDTSNGSATVVPLFIGSMNARDLTITNDGRYAFITCIIGHFDQIPMSIAGGWICENLIAAVDLETKTFADTIYLDEATHGAANPWGIAISPNSRYLAVAHAGTDEISLLNLPRMIRQLDNRQSRTQRGLGQYVALMPLDAESTMPARVRIPLGVKGMRQIVIDDHCRVFCTAAYEDLIGRIDFKITEPVKHFSGFDTNFDRAQKPKHCSPLQKIVDVSPQQKQTYRIEPMNELPYQSEKQANNQTAKLTFERLETFRPYLGFDVERSIARLGAPPIWNLARRGDVLFHDAVYCEQQWISCTSCHPDGRSDAINWDLLNDGMNNPKNTKSLLLSHETPPCMASGVRENAEIAVRAGVHSILFSRFQIEEDYNAIDEYLKLMKPVLSPRLKDGQFSDSARRGKLLFNDARTGCSNCHPEPYYTDLEKHNVGTRDYDTWDEYDTPTLIEVWRTAPYLHDGRYATLKELLTEGNHYAPDNRLKQLSEQEIDDLVEFVLSL